VYWPRRGAAFAELVRIGGQRVSLERVEDLKTMLDATEELVGVGELAGFLPREISPLGEPVERPQAVPLAQPGVLGPVEELERLDVELDVTYPADAQLHVALLLTPRAEEAVDAVLGRADLSSPRSSPGQ
jgi:hypothetical protein